MADRLTLASRGVELDAALDFDEDGELMVAIVDEDSAEQLGAVWLTREQVARVVLALAVAVNGTAAG